MDPLANHMNTNKKDQQIIKYSYYTFQRLFYLTIAVRDFLRQDLWSSPARFKTRLIGKAKVALNNIKSLQFLQLLRIQANPRIKGGTAGHSDAWLPTVLSPNILSVLKKKNKIFFIRNL